jgi:hypothetical protein
MTKPLSRWALERIPATRQTAQRLGVVTLRQMIGALVAAIENPPDDILIVDVPAIRRNAEQLGLRAMAPQC